MQGARRGGYLATRYRARPGLRIFLTGLALWVATVVVTCWRVPIPAGPPVSHMPSPPPDRIPGG